MEFGRPLGARPPVVAERVAPRHRDAHGNARRAQGREDEALARRDAVGREREATEAVALRDIDSREVEDEFGLRPRNGGGQVLREQREIGGVFEAVVEGDIEVGRRLPQGEVVPAVHREGEGRGVVGEDRRGAVPVVDIEIDDERAAESALGAERADRDRDIVEGAVPLARVAEGVVGTAREIRRDPPRPVERGARRGDRPADRKARAADEPRRPDDADPAFLVAREAAIAEFREIARVVHEGEELPRALLRLAEVPRMREPLGDERVVEQRVLPHGKRVPLGKRQLVVGVEREVVHRRARARLRAARRAPPRTPSCRAFRRGRASSRLRRAHGRRPSGCVRRRRRSGVRRARRRASSASSRPT